MNNMHAKHHEFILNKPSQVAKLQTVLKTDRSEFNLAKQITIWIRRKQHREHLLRLPDYLLRDIGLTRKEVMQESTKPFWKSGLF